MALAQQQVKVSQSAKLPASETGSARHSGCSTETGSCGPGVQQVGPGSPSSLTGSLTQEAEAAATGAESALSSTETTARSQAGRTLPTAVKSCTQQLRADLNLVIALSTCSTVRPWCTTTTSNSGGAANQIKHSASAYATDCCGLCQHGIAAANVFKLDIRSFSAVAAAQQPRRANCAHRAPPRSCCMTAYQAVSKGQPHGASKIDEQQTCTAEQSSAACSGSGLQGPGEAAARSCSGSAMELTIDGGRGAIRNQHHNRISRLLARSRSVGEE